MKKILIIAVAFLFSGCGWSDSNEEEFLSYCIDFLQVPKRNCECSLKYNKSKFSSYFAYNRNQNKQYQLWEKWTNAPVGSKKREQIMKKIDKNKNEQIQFMNECLN